MADRSDFLIALAGGAVGTALTFLAGAGARVRAIPGECRAHERAVRERDEDLEQWVTDEHVRLKRELKEIRAALSARNIFYSGQHTLEVSLAKERALQAYRDQERQATRDVAAVREREGWLHATSRSLSFRAERSLELRAPERVAPVLDAWRLPATRHLQPNETPFPINDPTRRTISDTLIEVATDTREMT
jgi:hypothetical protein